MDRMKALLRGIDKSMLGLEVAPWFNPIVPKAAGYNVHTLDVFDFDSLMSRAKDDPRIRPETYDKLEPIDYVGSATELASLVPSQHHGQFDYVISSHNFEHLPNPIKFLQQCETILTEGGSVIMAVPDGRACFDYFRVHTVTADWLGSYVEDRKQPSQAQLFAASVDAACVRGKQEDSSVSVTFDTPRSAIANYTRLQDSWSDWTESQENSPYVDAHCTVMTPASLQLLIEDCVALGLFSFDIEEVSPTMGVEFCIRLVKPSAPRSIDPEAFQARRTQLLHDLWNEQAVRYASTKKGTAAIAELSMNPPSNLRLLEYPS